MGETPTSTGDHEGFEGEGLSAWTLDVGRAGVMWLRYVLEASEGVGFLSGGKDGVVRLMAPHSQVAEVEAILRDLSVEDASLRVLARPAPPAMNGPAKRSTR